MNSTGATKMQIGNDNCGDRCGCELPFYAYLTQTAGGGGGNDDPFPGFIFSLPEGFDDQPSQVEDDEDYKRASIESLGMVLELQADATAVYAQLIARLN
jgi:hypothetical protein